MRHLTVDEAPAIFAWGVVGTVTASLLGGLTPAGTLDTDLAVVTSVVVIADAPGRRAPSGGRRPLASRS